jgi:SAM-dependent methyltransferase
MKWKTKAAIQSIVSLLPSSLSYAAYYWIQRNFGGLKKMIPIYHLQAGIEVWSLLLEQGHNPKNKVFFEVGTGRTILVPLAFWLMGAKKTITIDKNPYMKVELIQENNQYILNNQDEIKRIFGSLLDRERFKKLVEFSLNPVFLMGDFLTLTNTTYIAPGDASSTPLQANTIDYHVSYTVFEHIPPTILLNILKEGNRIIRDDGLFIHRIDYSDHFSHSDNTISSINFLQYSDKEWNKYAGNRYMYMNRLRHDDCIRLFESSGHTIVKEKKDIDPLLQELLQAGDLKLIKKFNDKPLEVLATIAAWIISKNASEISA